MMKKRLLIILILSSYLFDNMISCLLNNKLVFFSTSLIFLYSFLSFHCHFYQKLILWLIISFLIGCNYTNYFPISFCCMLIIMLENILYFRLFSMSSFEWISLLIINFISYYFIEYLLLKYVYFYHLKFLNVLVYEFINSLFLNFIVGIIMYYIYIFIENRIYRQQINK